MVSFFVVVLFLMKSAKNTNMDSLTLVGNYHTVG